MKAPVQEKINEMLAVLTNVLIRLATPRSLINDDLFIYIEKIYQIKYNKPYIEDALVVHSGLPQILLGLGDGEKQSVGFGTSTIFNSKGCVIFFSLHDFE